jgi:hypothetical protein
MNMRKIFIMAASFGLVIAWMLLAQRYNAKSAAQASEEPYKLIRAKDDCIYNKLKISVYDTEYQYIHSETCKNPKHRVYRHASSTRYEQ